LTEVALGFTFVLYFSLTTAAQTANIPARITQPVDPENFVTLRGNTHPLARPEFDQGAAPDSQPMERILLVLQRSPEQETALRELLDEQQIKSSPNYHMWLTPEQFGQQFGPADADIQAVTGWLTSQGFQVSRVAAGRTVIEFSGTAGAIRQAFHTEIHKYVVNGKEHWANASDPQIPAALKPVVIGLASLNNFPRQPMSRLLGTFSRSKATGVVTPLFTYPVGPNEYELGVGPGDIATIYNVSPLWSAGIDGTGQTIAIVSDSNINIQDARDFRSMFGLPANDPQIILNGPDPGVWGPESDEPEADIDVQWAGGVAKGATIDLVVSEDTEVSQGVDLSALYIIDNNLAPIMTESYGACELYLGAAEIQFLNLLWEQGAAQGITVIEAAGDSGAAACDVYGITGEAAAQYGLMVNGNASTPFNVAVGGTDFNDATDWQTYWNITNNSTTQSSALSYIPEMTWNDTCANTGSLSGCASGVASDGSDLIAGGGGPSDCAYPVVFSNGSFECTTSGGITGIPKPSWQTGTGVPNDQVRDIPDVSLFAGRGRNGSFYIFCEMDANAMSTPAGSSTSCDLNSPYTDFRGAGGTSVATQSFGGIMALVNQKEGRQGNANYVLYPLAAKSQSDPKCASSASAVTDTSCIFYDIQSGNNSVACFADSLDCSNQSITGQGYGILVEPTNSAEPAWPTGAGYDLATGLGTVNAANLVNQWSSVEGTFTPTKTTLTLTPPTGYTLATIPHGQTVTVTANVTPASATGDVSVIGGPSGGILGIGPFTLGSGGTASGTTVMLPGGTYGVSAYYAGNGTYGSSTSSPVTVTVTPESSKTFVQLVTETCTAMTYGATTVPYGYMINCSGTLYLGSWLKMDVTNSSGSLNASDTATGGVGGVCYGSPAYQCPTGQAVVTLNGSTMPPAIEVGAPPDDIAGTYTLNSQGYAEDQFLQLPGGTDALVASYTPHPIGAAPCLGLSYCTSTSAAATITVTQASTTASVSASNTSPTSGTPVTLTALVSTASAGLAPSGTVQFQNNGVAIPGTVTYTPVSASPNGNASLCLAPLAPYTVCASLTATLTTSFTANASVTAQYVGDTNYSGSTSPALEITISGGQSDFSVGAAPSSFAIAAPGQSGSTTISATALNGFTGTVTFTCTLPAAMTYSTCAFNPTSITIPATPSTLLTVNTTAPSMALRPFNRPRWFIPSTGALFGSILLLLMLGKKRRVKLAFGLLVLALLAAAFVACGGGGTTITPPSGGTPTGSYTATVTGTSGNLSHSVNVTVTVQ
jgi:hypothetical protein